MVKLPGILVVVDPSKEDIAVKEARKLEIPVVGLVDTDTGPELIDIVIPCNDDAFRSIKVLLDRLTDAVVGGRKVWEERREIVEKAKAKQPAQSKTSRPRDAARTGGKPRRRTASSKSGPPSRSRGPGRARVASKKEESKQPSDKKTEAKEQPKKQEARPEKQAQETEAKADSK